MLLKSQKRIKTGNRTKKTKQVLLTLVLIFLIVGCSENSFQTQNDKDGDLGQIIDRESRIPENLKK